MPNLVEITIKADDETAGGFASVLSKYYALKNAMKDIVVDVGDSGNVTSSLIGIKQKVQAIGLADIADVNVPPGILFQRLWYIKRAMQQVGLGDIYGIGASGLLQKRGPTSSLIAYQNAQNYLLAKGGSGGGAAAGASGGQGGQGGGGIMPFIGGLLSGGSAKGGIFGAFAGAGLGGLLGIHALVDLVIEGLISIGSAAIAAAAGFAVMAPTLGNINDHLQAVNTVSKALGQNIPPLSSNFQKMAKAMAPQTIELYGAGISIVNQAIKNTGPGVSNVVNLFDTWAAKTVNWMQTQNTFGTIMKTGTVYLSMFGTLLGTLGQALGNLIQKDPGIAKWLITLLQGVASLFKAFSDLPAPIVSAVLALHGLWLWGSILGRVLLALVGYFRGVTVAMIEFIALNPLALPAIFVAIAAAVGYLSYELTQGTPAVKSFLDNWTNFLSSEKASQFIYSNVSALGAFDSKLKQINTTFENTQLNQMNLGQQLKTIVGSIGILEGRTFKDFFTGHWLSGITNELKTLDIIVLGGQKFTDQIMAQEDVTKIQQRINEVLGSEKNLFHETGSLMAGGAYTFQQAIGLMDLAGVKQSDSFTVMHTKVQDLIQGYKDMSVQGGILANSVNAVTFQTMLQDSHVATLTGAWDSFFSTVSGGLSGYLSAVQAINTLQSGLQSGGNLSGTDTQSITNQQNAISAIQAIQKEQDAMLTAAAAANMGAQGTKNITTATKDYLQALIPLIGQNQQFLPLLNAIAQQGGMQGAAGSIADLAKWAGPPVQNPLAQAAGIAETFDTKIQNLNTDVQNLSTALGTTLTDAMHQAIFLAAGGQKPFTDFASAVLTSHGNLSLMQGSATTLIGTLTRLDPSHAKQLFEDFAGMLGITKANADALYQKSLPSLQAVINGMHGTTIVITTLYRQQGLTSATYQSQVPAAARAMGGISHAASGGGKSGLTIVGEYGAELIKLPSGSHVLPHSNQAAQLASMGGGGGGWMAQVSVAPGTGNQFERLLLQVIRLIVLKNGGGGTSSVQRAFGQVH